MKNKKAPGDDHITVEMMKLAGNTVERALTILLNKQTKNDQEADL